MVVYLRFLNSRPLYVETKVRGPEGQAGDALDGTGPGAAWLLAAVFIEMDRLV